MMTGMSNGGYFTERAIEGLLQMPEGPVKMRLITAAEVDHAAGGTLPGPVDGPFPPDSVFEEVMRARVLRNDRDSFVALACHLIERLGGSVTVDAGELTRRDGKLILEQDSDGIRLRVERP